jgi:hypothetical protein
MGWRLFQIIGLAAVLATSGSAHAAEVTQCIVDTIPAKTRALVVTWTMADFKRETGRVSQCLARSVLGGCGVPEHDDVAEAAGGYLALRLMMIQSEGRLQGLGLQPSVLEQAWKAMGTDFSTRFDAAVTARDRDALAPLFSAFLARLPAQIETESQREMVSTYLLTRTREPAMGAELTRLYRLRGGAPPKPRDWNDGGPPPLLLPVAPECEPYR